jgi:hypothetical protein
MQEPATDVSPEKERLFLEMEAELARYNQQIARRKRGEPLPPEPQFDRELFLEMRGWQADRLGRKVDEELVPLMRNRYQQREQQETE